MWVVAGLWHNLILPNINSNVEAHHQGIFIMLIAYVILGFLMVYIFTTTNSENKSILKGLKIGALVGVLWVFPHGLVMASAHDTSIIYEIKNGIWHMVEQGIGGVVISIISSRLH